MALDWQNIDHWEAGEIALLTLIAFLLALLCLMIVGILYYGQIYHTLKENEGKPLYKPDGDGPYNQTTRPHSYHEDSSDEDEEDDDGMDEENNINMANKSMQKSFGHGPLIQHRGGNMMRYNTNTTVTNQSASTESDSQTTGSSDTNEEDSVDTHSNVKDNDDDDDEDSDVRNHRNRHPQIQHHSPLRGYNYIGRGGQPHMVPVYQGQYGNEVMQQHHNKVSHQPPPPPGAINQHNLSHSNVYTVTSHKGHPSNSTITSLTSITATEPRYSNNKATGNKFANQHPISDRLSKDFVYSPSDKESRPV